MRLGCNMIFCEHYSRTCAIASLICIQRWPPNFKVGLPIWRDCPGVCVWGGGGCACGGGGGGGDVRVCVCRGVSVCVGVCVRVCVCMVHVYVHLWVGVGVHVCGCACVCEWMCVWVNQTDSTPLIKGTRISYMYIYIWVSHFKQAVGVVSCTNYYIGRKATQGDLRHRHPLVSGRSQLEEAVEPVRPVRTGVHGRQVPPSVSPGPGGEGSGGPPGGRPGQPLEQRWHRPAHPWVAYQSGVSSGPYWNVVHVCFQVQIMYVQHHLIVTAHVWQLTSAYLNVCLIMFMGWWLASQESNYGWNWPGPTGKCY